MKNKFKIFSIIILLFSSFIMVACDMKQNANITNDLLQSYISNRETKKENENDLDSFESCYFYQEYYSDGLLEEMSNNKNKKYEMEVGVYETYDEMVEEYLKTFLLIVCDFYSPSKDKMCVNAGSGNIYDIDDEYMYIITCAHITKDSDDDVLQQVTIRFVDDTLLTLDPSYVTLAQNNIDVALIKIPLSLINESTLSIVKTINISHAYQGSVSEFESKVLYCYKFHSHIYDVYYILGMEETKLGFRCEDNKIADGTSGGGIIDRDGNYYTLVLKENCLSPIALYYFNDLLNNS